MAEPKQPTEVVSSDEGAKSRGLPSQVRKLRTGLTETRVRSPELLLSLVLLSIPIALVGYFGREQIEQAAEQQTAQYLKATLDAATSSVELWMETCSRSHQTATGDPRVSAALACLDPRNDSMGCIQSLHAALDPYAATTMARVDIVALSHNRVWTVVGDPMTEDERRAFGTALRAMNPKRGAPVYLTPFALSATRALSGFASIVGTEFVLFTEVSAPSLSRSMLAGRAGSSGETYGVDGQGHMLTESRFAAQLRLAGLLSPTQASTVLSVEIRDPGVNLVLGERTGTLRSEQPLTRMAEALVRGESGVNVSGYRDYRGVPVVGAWRWLPTYRIGIATESDRDEALAPVLVLNQRFFLLLGLLAAVAVGLALTALATVRIRKRATRALARIDEMGQYRIERKLGEGGMGTVYLARHMLLRRPTAIKVLRQDRDDDTALARFEREVRATSELSHPNTVAIYDYGRAVDGTFFYAMEYLDGLDLDHLVRQHGPLSEARVVHFMVQVCGSLDEAHRHGLVHRDIKPSNVFICKREGAEDLLKVLDFGIVKADLEGGPRITRSSTVIGTPEYMAPEMFDRAHGVGPQSDIYSLGAVAYFMLTGRSVFEASTMAELCTAHLVDEPKPPSQRAGREIDRALEEIVLACLAKRPQDRPAGATRLRELLLHLPCARDWTDDDARRFWQSINDTKVASALSA